MAHPLALKNNAIKMRTDGFSIKEIANKLNIAKSTSSLWVRDVELNKNAIKRLKKRKIFGQYKTSLYWKNRRKQIQKNYYNDANLLLKNTMLNVNHKKIILAILFWAEGSKTTQLISFINSDPTMISTFMTLMRTCYTIDESKFRALLHAHEYHNISKQIEYWSEILHIPTSQFSKTYLKPHTGKRTRKNYPGSLRIRYYDTKIARELTAIYNVYASHTGL